MRKLLEKLATFLILAGFFIFGGGAVVAILTVSKKYGTPFEITIALIGLTLILLGVLAAKLFSEVGLYE